MFKVSQEVLKVWSLEVQFDVFQFSLCVGEQNVTVVVMLQLSLLSVFLRQVWVLHCRLHSRSAGVEIETAPEPAAGQVSDGTGTCMC